MDHRTKEGLTKARIIDAVIAGYDTREQMMAFLGGTITRKDLNYHLSKSTNNGLGFEHVLSERKGRISISMRGLSTISKAIGYLVKLPKYREAFDTGFAECFYSGFGESLHYIASVAGQREKREEDDYSTAWAALMPISIINDGVRVPWNLVPETRGTVAKLAVRIFEDVRVKLDDEEQLAYIVNVIDKCTTLTDPNETMLAKDTTVFLSIGSIIRNAREKNDLVVLAFNRIIETANQKRKTILGNVSEREKVLMNAALLMVSVYNWKAPEFVSVMPVMQDLLKLHTDPSKNGTSYDQIKEILKNLPKTYVKR